MGKVWSGLSLVAVLLSDPNMVRPDPECREIKEDQEKSNAHSCWEILERKLISVHCL